MPNIRPYEQQVAATGQIPGRAAGAEDFGGDIGEGLYALGVGGIRAGHEYRQEQEKLLTKQKQDELLRGSVEIAKGQSQWLQWQNDNQAVYPDGAGFTAKFNEEFTKYKDKALEAMTLPETKLAYEAQLERLRASLTDNALKYEGTARAKAQVNSVRQGFAANENSVRAQPTLMPEVREQEKKTIAGLTGLDANTRDQLVIERTQKVTGAAMDGNISMLIDTKSPQALQAYLDHIKTEAVWKRDMAPPDYERALNTLQSAIRTLGTQDMRHQSDALKEAVAQKEAGVGPDLPASMAAFIPDPIDRKKAEGIIATANRVGNASQKLKTLPIGEALAYLQSLEAKVNEPDDVTANPGAFTNDVREYQATVTALNARFTAYKNDPATYATSNSAVVKQNYDQFVANATPATAKGYADAVIAEQQRLYPGVPTRILSQDQVGQMKMQLAEIPNTPEGADKALQLLQSQATLWGNNWPAVYRQLAQEKVLSAPQRMAARMTEPTRQSTARLLLEAANVGEKELKKQLDLPELNKDMKTAITTTLAPLQTTLRFQSNGVQAYGDTFDSVELLAMKYMTMGERNMSRAVERAADAIIMQDYHYRGTYFVPRAENIDTIETGLKVATKAAPNLSIVPPTDLAGLREADIKAGYQDALRAGAIWVTNDDATGVMLAWPNARRERVMVKDGEKTHPLEYTWGELRSMGVAEINRPRPRGKLQPVFKNPAAEE